MKNKLLQKIYLIIQTPRAIYTIAAALLILIIAGTIYEQAVSKSETIKIMNNTAETIARIIAYSGEKSTIAMKKIDKELSDNFKLRLRLLGKLDGSGNLSPEFAGEYAKALNIRLIKTTPDYQILFAAVNGENILTNKMNWLKTHFTNEISAFEVRNLTPNSKYRKTFALRLADGNLLYLIPDEKTYDYRYSIGVGAMLKQFTAFPEIKYIIWEDEKGLVAAAGDYQNYLNSQPNNDDIFEVRSSLTYQIGNAKHGSFRIGMSAENLKKINRDGLIRLTLIVFIILILAFVLVKLTTLRREVEMEKIKNEHFISMGKLAAGVAHEVRNPLNVIGLSLQQLLSDKAMMDEHSGNHILITTACEEIKRADKTLLDFLKCARPPEINKKQTNIKKLFQKVVSVIKPKCIERDIVVKTNCNENLIADIDPELFHQVILNLALNSIDAMPNGGTLKFIASGYKNELVMIVSDTGTGIDTENYDKIFELYYTTKIKGIGLGLPFVHRIVTMHGGKISVSNNKPKGVNFKIIL